MKKNNLKLLVIFWLVIILLANIYFVSSQEDLPSKVIDLAELGELTEEDIANQGLEYKELSEKEGGGKRITFVSEDASVFNIVPQKDAKHPTYVEVDENGEIRQADFTVDEEGGTYVFGNTEIYAPANSRVFFDQEEGVRIKVPENGKLEQFPELKGEEGGELMDYNIIIEGNNIELPKGIMSGTLSYKNGQAFIAPGEKVEINGVEINSEDLSETTKIFFDGKSHEGISFGKDNLIIKSQEYGYSPVITFNGNNSFVQIEGGDYFAFYVGPSCEIEVQNRDSLNLIPRVTYKAGGGEFDSANVQEDFKSISISRESVYIGSPILNRQVKDSTTSPIEFVILDQEGNSLLEGQKIFVDNFNRIAIVPEDTEEFLISSEGIDTKFSARLKYNYPTKESIELLTGKGLNFSEVPKGKEDMLLGKLRDYWETLTPDIKESVQYIEFAGKSYFEEIMLAGNKGSEQTIAFAKIDGGMIFRDDEGIYIEEERKFNIGTFRHEATHVHHYQIEEDFEETLPPEQRDAIKEIKRKLVENHEKIRELEIKMGQPPKEEEIKEMRGLLEEFYTLKDRFEETRVPPPFEVEWLEVVGGEEAYIPYYSGNQPIDGFVRGYGAENLKEDVATFNEHDTKPEFFKCLIKPGCRDYDSRYREKIDLKYKYKFMSKEKHSEILQAAGVR